MLEKLQQQKTIYMSGVEGLNHQLLTGKAGQFGQIRLHLANKDQLFVKPPQISVLALLLRNKCLVSLTLMVKLDSN